MYASRLGAWRCQAPAPNQRFAYDRYMGRYCVQSQRSVCVVEMLPGLTMRLRLPGSTRCIYFDGRMQARAIARFSERRRVSDAHALLAWSLLDFKPMSGPDSTRPEPRAAHARVDSRLHFLRSSYDVALAGGARGRVRPARRAAAMDV